MFFAYLKNFFRKRTMVFATIAITLFLAMVVILVSKYNHGYVVVIWQSRYKFLSIRILYSKI